MRDGVTMLRLHIGARLCALIPPLAGGRTRRLILTASGVPIGRGSTFAGCVRISGRPQQPQPLRFGGDCFVNTGASFDISAPIEIGDGVSIAHDVTIVTSGDDAAAAPRPVIIEGGCWIGARATIRPGVTVGHGSIVAAGAVVTDDVEPGSLVAGIPAQLLRRLP